MTTDNSNQDKNLSFEEAYALLEEKVSALEEGGLALEASIILFEEGMSLLSVCNELLNNAELKITTLHDMYSAKITTSHDSVKETNEY